MATTKGKKPARKKKEEVAKESPAVQVVEKAVEEKVSQPKAKEPKKAPVKAEPKSEPVREELPPQPLVEEPKKEETLPEPKAEIQQEEAAVVEKPVLGIGSRVRRPSGKIGTVININRKGYFEVQSEINPGKTYLYSKNQLSLVK